MEVARHLGRCDQLGAIFRWAAGGIGGGRSRLWRVQPAYGLLSMPLLRPRQSTAGCDNRSRVHEGGGHWPAGAGRQWQRSCEEAIVGVCSGRVRCLHRTALRLVRTGVRQGGRHPQRRVTGRRQPWMSTPAKAGLRDRETRNALEVDGLGGRRRWGISSESSLGRRGPGPAASRGRGTRHRSLTSNGGQWQCALHDDDGCGVLARIH